jgi:uncharacterized protein (TIGR03083 family)
VDVTALIEHLAADGPAFVEAVSRVQWDDRVPHTDWDVRQLVTHLGGVQRWAADIVETRSAAAATAAGEAVGAGPGDDRLLDWFRDGHSLLVETLSSAPADLDCFTFLPAESPLHFWARRQAHEMAIHRADAQAAADLEVPSYGAGFAQDGIGELLNGFARRRSNAIAVTATMGLDAGDGPSWLLTFGGERIEAVEADDLTDTDVTIRGLSSDLYLWLWNRQSGAVLDGDAEVAGRWSRSVRVRWS